MNVRAWALASLFLIAAPVAAQSGGRDPVRLFPYQAPIRTHGRAFALVRLPLTPDVLARSRPDLSDVRIHDAQGHEQPFVVDSGARPWPRDATLPTFVAAPVSIDRRIERGRSLAPSWREVVRVAPPGDAPEGARWSLRIESASRTFVRSIAVRRLDGSERTVIATGTVYRLQDPLREQLRIELPVLPRARTAAPLIEVEIAGEGGYIEPELTFLATRALIEPPTLSFPLTVLARGSDRGSTFVDLARPVGVAPDRLSFVTSSAHFHRAVHVFDVSQGRDPQEIGQGVIFRAQGVGNVEVSSVDVSAARGEVLRVQIRDGDSPPLAALRVVAVVRQPVLVFELPASELTLRFGGGRARAPRYDLASFSGTELGEAMLGVEAPIATLGPSRENPRFDDRPALRFAMRPGRAVEVSRFTHVASVEVRGARDGSSRVRLPPAVLAAARSDLGDVRVTDRAGRQWPYLLVPRAEPEDLVRGRVARPLVSGRRSTYVVSSPFARVPVARMVLYTDAPYLVRPYVVRGIDEYDRPIELARGTLRRAPDEALPIPIELGERRVSRIELEIEDGNDAPLEISRVELAVVRPTLFLVAPNGDYRLYVGDEEASAPSYEIEDARELILAVRAVDARVGRATRNPAHVEPPWYRRVPWGTWIVWLVLVLAVGVLAFVTLRLAQKPDEGAPAVVPAPQEETPPSNDEPPPTPPDTGPSTKPLSF